eukprot:CAMPEP_0113937574 /NCGR_PEP_ID=MMETSP1339-20121228/4169_1 /TAXON_ID=94617 /ORGANISM="Fibrocapsa japonica" /LENGTH=446 /DNA_ID=CAMNT_0000940395 /DNA_START=198 /DNA_END=1538 /DNA_ORIENTATION=+ /assembly_acc=CAM_ASM_000762
MSGQIMVVATALIVAACAVLAALGFRGRDTVIGVDLGTTFSVVGINEEGKVHIVKDTRSGSRLVPSMVAFLDNGEVAVGEAALVHQEHHPENTIYNAKRFIGRDFDDPSVALEAAEHDYKIARGQTKPKHYSNDTLWDSSDFSGVRFVITASGHPPFVTPETVGANVLTRLLQITADYVGHTQVDKAVIAVPAKFDARQRQATAEAYRRAGLKVTRVLEEPTAAALAYGLHRKPDVHHIMVYDFGGGTLDVSVLFVNDGSVEVIASEGDPHLGGSDFDQCLAHHLQSQLGDHRLVDLEGYHQSEKCNLAVPVCTHHMLYPLAEALKRRLSDVPSSSVTCLAPTGQAVRGADICAPTMWEEVSVDVSKAQFESICTSLFERSLKPVDYVLEEAGLEKESIDEVVMVGGTTRIPYIRDSLKVHLNVPSLNTHIDPDVTVAYGAASVID